MELIDIKKLQADQEKIRADFQSKKPFRYTVIEGLFKPEKADEIHDAYPPIKDGVWDGTTYIDQKAKFRKTEFEDGSIIKKAFDELNSPEFLKFIESVTEVEVPLIADDELFGGGLHQSINGAFLNVHVDYNIHPTTKHHRRFNAIVFMNKEWKPEYEGDLELWDMTDNKKELLGKYAPAFNRCVIFETNEISFHGHPKPLNTPEGVNRKSLAVYYYTETRPEHEIAEEHNTIFVNTEGVTGQVKRFNSGVKAFFERLKK